MKNLTLSSSKEGYVELREDMYAWNMHHDLHYKVVKADPMIMEEGRPGSSEVIYSMEKLAKIKLKGEKKFNNFITSLPSELQDVVKDLSSKFEVYYDTSAMLLQINSTNSSVPVYLLRDKMQFLLEYDETLLGTMLNKPKLKVEKMTKARQDFSMTTGLIRKEFVSTNLPKQQAGMIERSDMIEKIQKSFETDNIVAINAPKGGGKTEVASQYCHKVEKEDEVGFTVRWFGASSPEKLKSSYANFANEIGINEDLHSADLASRVNTKLSASAGSNRKIILVFDDVKNYSDIEKYLPNLVESNVNILITTACCNLLENQRGVHVTLDPLSKAEAISYIKRYFDRTMEEQDIDKLVKIFLSDQNNILPKKLSKDIEFFSNRKGTSVDKCIIEYNKITNGEDLEKELFNVFDLFSGKDSNPIKLLASEVLSYASYLNPNYIEKEILVELTGKNSSKINQAIGELEKMSLGSMVNGHRGLKIDLVIHDMAKKQIKGTEASNDYIATISNILNEMMPQLNNDMTPQNIKKAHKLYSHMSHFLSDDTASNSKSVVELFCKLSDYENFISRDYKKSLEYGEKARLKAESIYGKNSINTINIVNRLATVNNKLGDLAKLRQKNSEAQDYYNKSVKYFESIEKQFLKLKSVNEQLKTKVYSHLGNLYVNLGEYNGGVKGEYIKAEEYYKKALDLIGDNHLGKADLLCGLGRAYCLKASDESSYMQALYYHLQSLQIKKLFGGTCSSIKDSKKEIKDICNDKLGKDYKKLKNTDKFSEMVYHAIPSIDNFELMNKFASNIFDKLSKNFEKSYNNKSKIYDKISKILSSAKKTNNDNDQYILKPLFDNSSIINIEEGKVGKKLSNTLQKISDLSKEGNWSFGYLSTKLYRTNAIAKLGDCGVKGYVDEKFLKKVIGNDCTRDTLDIAKMLCFEAICIGVSLQPEPKNYSCIDKFLRTSDGKKIVQRVIKEHPEYFVNARILGKYSGLSGVKEIKDRLSDFYNIEVIMSKILRYLIGYLLNIRKNIQISPKFIVKFLKFYPKITGLCLIKINLFCLIKLI